MSFVHVFSNWNIIILTHKSKVTSCSGRGCNQCEETQILWGIVYDYTFHRSKSRSPPAYICYIQSRTCDISFLIPAKGRARRDLSLVTGKETVFFCLYHISHPKSRDISEVWKADFWALRKKLEKVA